MKSLDKKHIKEQGFTLMELALVVPLVAIIFLIAYNLLFVSFKSMDQVNNTFNTSEDIRIFLNNIQKEANQAKKAVDNEDIGPLYRPNKNEIYIYTDIGSEKPELIRYRLEDNKILRSVKKSTNEKYPYTFEKTFKNERVVLSNVKNKDIFGEVEDLKVKRNDQEADDYRKKLKLSVEIYTKENSTPIVINTYLVSKSRAEFE